MHNIHFMGTSNTRNANGEVLVEIILGSFQYLNHQLLSNIFPSMISIPIGFQVYWGRHWPVTTNGMVQSCLLDGGKLLGSANSSSNWFNIFFCSYLIFSFIEIPGETTSFSFIMKAIPKGLVCNCTSENWNWSNQSSPILNSLKSLWNSSCCTLHLNSLQILSQAVDCLLAFVTIKGLVL